MNKNGEHFVTCGQMKVLERRADESGLSYYRMMENAGVGAAGIIMQSIGGAGISEEVGSYEGVPVAERSDEPRNIYVFCGKGNNGGDGFVAARILHDSGHKVTVILVDGEPKTQDSITNLGLIRIRGLKILDMAENNRALLELDESPDVIVDAIYGTGFRGGLSGNGLKAVTYINNRKNNAHSKTGKSDVKIIALDIPSGLGGDIINAEEAETAGIRADITITFHAKKPVHVQKFAEEFCGRIAVVDIGIDEEKLWNIEV